MDPKSNAPRPIADILNTLKETTELGRSLHEAQIWERWPEIVGPILMHHGQPLRVRDQVLTIAVESSVWMHRISYKKCEIIEKIEQFLGPDFVRELFFTLLDEEPSKK